MKKQTSFYVLVGLLILSVIASIYFQIAWIQQMYKNKLSNFRHTSMVALEDVLRAYAHEKHYDTLSTFSPIMIGGMTNDPMYCNAIDEVYHSDEDWLSKIPPMSKNTQSIALDSFQSLGTLSMSKQIILTKNEFKEIEKILKKEMYSSNLLENFTIEYIPLHIQDIYIPENEKKEFSIFFGSGFFKFTFDSISRYILLKMLPVLISFFILIVIMIGSMFLLISNYIKDRKLALIKNNFINNLTHELQTPITISNLALEKISLLNKNNDINEYIAITQKENNRISKLSQRILTLADINKSKMHLETINPNEIIDNVIIRFNTVLDKEDQISNKSTDTKIEIKLDKNLFIDIIYNLIDNALKYSKTPRLISVSTSINIDYFIIDITDNGIGIPKEYLEKIFDPFFRISKNDTYAIKGHGLGLSYVKEIIKKMNGKINVYSKNRKGTVFNIQIPINIY